jgi:hypothetical protein
MRALTTTIQQQIFWQKLDVNMSHLLMALFMKLLRKIYGAVRQISDKIAEDYQFQLLELMEFDITDHTSKVLRQE